jgi:two-component system OmpR family sensor kinase
MRIWPASVRWRLTLWYSMVLAALLGAFAVGSRYVLASVLDSRADWFLQEARAAFLSEFDVELRDRTADIAAHTAMRDVRFRDITFLVYDAERRLLASSDDSIAATHSAFGVALPDSFDRTTLPALLGRSPTLVRVVSAPDPQRHRVAIGNVLLRGRRFTVAAVQSREAQQTALARVTLAYIVVIPAFLLLAGFGGYELARRALAPVASMSRQARVIGATNLHERLPVHNPRDELGQVATMVNELLQRLEESFEQQRRFMANASHELRTPVAIVRAESEIALGMEGRAEAEYREALRVIHDAADRMSRIVHDLFLLARADTGHLPIMSEPLYLDEIAADVARSMRGVATQNGVRIELGSMGEAPFVGDVELLGRMLINLVDNAIKYSPPETTINIGLERQNGMYRLSVKDQGSGIPEEAQPHVFDRFFRADKARSRTGGSATGGAGLGLAIVQLVAEAHGGKAALVKSSESGTEFAVSLPVRDGEGGDAG